MISIARSIPVVVAVVMTTNLNGAAHADPPDISGQAASDAYELVGQQAMEPAESAGSAVTQVAQTGSDSADSPYTDYRWLSVCVTPTTAGPLSETLCTAAQVCPTEEELMYRLWGRDDAGVWIPLAAQCFGESPPQANNALPAITPGLVLEEIRRIGLPTLQAMTQPEGRTLVNFDTIFYTEAEPFTATVPLLGRQVAIEARPTSYAWHHGDGQVTETDLPGAPYPAKDIIHRYAEANTTVRTRVDVTYTARFRVNGGAWQDIDETVTITGPENPLRVSEAAPVLSGDYSG